MEYLLKRPSTGYNTEKEREFAKWSGVSDWEVFFQNKKIGDIYYVGTLNTEWGWSLDGFTKQGKAPTRQWALEYLKEFHKESRIKFIVEQEKNAKNSWKWVEKADDKTINDLYNYWTQEM